jgi:hypothetical protein
MESSPLPLTAGTWEEVRTPLIAAIKELYEKRVGGALIGSDFEISGDTLTLKVKGLSGVNTYYVAATSGGSPTVRLTFLNGVLVSDT